MQSISRGGVGLLLASSVSSGSSCEGRPDRIRRDPFRGDPFQNPHDAIDAAGGEQQAEGDGRLGKRLGRCRRCHKSRDLNPNTP